MSLQALLRSVLFCLGDHVKPTLAKQLHKQSARIVGAKWRTCWARATKVKRSASDSPIRCVWTAWIERQESFYVLKIWEYDMV
jgi:hypothetical protein